MVTRHIIVVNDDAIFLDLMQELLEAEGYRVTLGASTTQAMAAIRKAQPDLIMVDLRIGSPDEGLQLIQTLRLAPSTRHIPLVLCTADGAYLRDNGDRLRGQDIAILPKPFDLDALLDLVQRLIGGPTRGVVTHTISADD